MKFAGARECKGEISNQWNFRQDPYSAGVFRIGRLTSKRKAMNKFLFALVLLLLLPIQASAEATRWHSYQEGLKKAKAENRKIFLNFHADW